MKKSRSHPFCNKISRPAPFGNLPMPGCPGPVHFLRRRASATWRKPDPQNIPSIHPRSPIRSPPDRSSQYCHIPSSWSGVKGDVSLKNPAVFRENTVIFPEKWIIRGRTGLLWEVLPKEGALECRHILWHYIAHEPV